jgi:WbqC-like protein family
MPFTVAIMQPYFIPYAGYFRLFAASDLFVIYDCVQFPRRGWVHRNRLTDKSGVERWLTLPLEHAPQSVLIRDLRFAPDAAKMFTARLRSFPLVASEPATVAPVLDALHDIGGRPVDYIERLLMKIVSHLGLPWKTIRSSTLGVPASFRGQDRIIEIAQRLRASRYVNAPGGRTLYKSGAFQDAGIELEFLTDYVGPNSSILTRLLSENRRDIAGEIRASSAIGEPAKSSEP